MCSSVTSVDDSLYNLFYTSFKEDASNLETIKKIKETLGKFLSEAGQRPEKVRGLSKFYALNEALSARIASLEASQALLPAKAGDSDVVMATEVEKKVKAEETLAADATKQPDVNMVIEVLKKSYFINYGACKDESELKAVDSFTKEFVGAALVALEKAGIKDWNNIDESSFKKIMQASDWNGQFKEPETVSKLFALIIGRFVEKRTIDLYQLAVIFTWLGSPKTMIAQSNNSYFNAEDIIKQYHYVFFTDKLHDARMVYFGVVHLEGDFVGFKLGQGDPRLFGGLSPCRNLILCDFRPGYGKQLTLAVAKQNRNPSFTSKATEKYSTCYNVGPYLYGLRDKILSNCSSSFRRYNYYNLG